MKRIGIVGGMGPVSTIDYYSGIIEGYRAKAQDNSYPEIVIDSIDMTKMLSFAGQKNWDALKDMLLASIENLSNAGAEFAAIASNTPHIVFDSLVARSALPLISIVDSTCRFAKSKGCKKAVITGTRFTMGSGLYSEALSKYGIEAATPSDVEQEVIHGIIFPKLEDGIVVPEDKRKMLALAERIISEQNADAIILGCTELPLMIKDGDLDALILDTAKIHIDAIVEAM